MKRRIYRMSGVDDEYLMECPKCDGTGTWPDSIEPCPACHYSQVILVEGTPPEADFIEVDDE